MKCHDCQAPATKAIYMGLPTYWCFLHECPILLGGLGSLLALVWFNGIIRRYDGSYLKALWARLNGT